MQHWQWDSVPFPVWTRFPASAIAGYGSRPSRLTIPIWHAVPVNSCGPFIQSCRIDDNRYSDSLKLAMHNADLLGCEAPQRKASSDVPIPSTYQADRQQTSLRACESISVSMMLPRGVRFADEMQHSVSNFGPVLPRGGCVPLVGVELVFVARFGERLYWVHVMYVVGPGRRFGYASHAINRDQWYWGLGARVASGEPKTVLVDSGKVQDSQTIL